MLDKESQSGTKEQSQKSVLEAILPFRVFQVTFWSGVR